MRLGAAWIERIVGAERIDQKADLSTAGRMWAQSRDDDAGAVVDDKGDLFHAFAPVLPASAYGQPVRAIDQLSGVERNLRRQLSVDDRLLRIIEVDPDARPGRF
jgi:hypothetical protein